MYGSIKKFKFTDNDKIQSYVKLVNEEIIQPMEREICVVHNLSSINDMTEVIFKEVYLKFDEQYNEDIKNMESRTYHEIVYDSIHQWFYDVEQKNRQWDRHSYPEFVDEPEPSEDEKVRDVMKKVGDYWKDRLDYNTEVSKPKEDNPKGDPVKVFDWVRWEKYEENNQTSMFNQVLEYVYEFYGVEDLNDLTEEQLSSIDDFREKNCNPYYPMYQSLGEIVRSGE